MGVQRSLGATGPPGGAGRLVPELLDYYGICRRLDECYGRVLDRLEDLGALEETIVLFVSDHGSHFRTRNDEYKRSCHDASIRVPMVAHGPGFEGGNAVLEPVSLIDVAPTLLDAAGLAVPEAMEGESVLGLVEGTAASEACKDEVFVQVSEAECGRTIRADRWTFGVYDPGAGLRSDPASPTNEYVERYLYDRDADPHQQTNLVSRPAYDDVARRLREGLVERIRAVEGVDVTVHPADYYA